MASAIESLPAEILNDVADILASDHLPSLHAFSLASRRCCSITNPHRFRKIHFSVAAEDRLQIDILHWERVLESANAFPFVRRLSVDGHLPSEEFNDPDDLLDLEVRDRPNKRRRSFSGEDEWTFKGAQYINVLQLTNNEPDPEDAKAMEAWKPLSQFLEKLSGLRDLFWLTSVQFPPCLLDVLHETLPKCRLHLKAFKLGSLRDEQSGPDDLNRHEYALATSPSLTSIMCTAQRNEGTAMRLAAGHAPNLNQVCLVYQGNQIAHGPDRFKDQPSTPSSLHSLSLYDPSPASLDAWSSHVSFSNLLALQIATVNDTTVLAKAAEYQFPSLKTLILRLRMVAYEESLQEAFRLDNDAATFLSNLPPLENLLIVSYYAKESLTAALQHHGPTLTRLGLIFINRGDPWRSQVTRELIDSIRAHCPNLQDLTLRIPRSGGNTKEVNVYRSLGKLTRLKHITLELDCTAFKFPARRTTTQDGPDPKHVLVNLAVDESLVRAILAIITDSSLSSLRSLKVYTEYGRMPLDLERFARVMKSIWEAYRVADGWFVYKRDGWKKKCHESLERKLILNKHSRYETHFRDLWPVKGRNWMEDWGSFPLEGVGDGPSG
ncbi:uncharacterized protein BJX67DRAFT_363206 [Aspergillus lucknowensis]|uniref:F-box domain-containing protein n=1 Tax=Aspergillus lucknowensis TaxID=176173 RepID=A0ABR4LGD2_9EURO